MDRNVDYNVDRIGVRELRQHASRYLARVKGGHRVEVTDRGELVALLVPSTSTQTRREELIAAGWLLPATAPIGRLRNPQPVTAHADTPTNQELLDAERAERV